MINRLIALGVLIRQALWVTFIFAVAVHLTPEKVHLDPDMDSQIERCWEDEPCWEDRPAGL